MLPIYFGDPQKALFGIYHPPRQVRSRPMSVVLCHPFGNEYVGAYRTMRVLANQLSDAGVAVLRFDYYGTGDSSGTSTDASVTQWLQDIDLAIEEIQGTSGAERTSLIGLRLGGTLATLAASQRDDIDRVVLWEPVLSGDNHVARHRERHEKWLQDDRCRAEDSTDQEALGYPLTDALQDEIGQLDLHRERASKPNKVLLLFHSEERKQPEQSLQKFAHEVEQHIVDSADFWLGRTGYDQPLVSTTDVQSIVSWLTGGSG